MYKKLVLLMALVLMSRGVQAEENEIQTSGICGKTAEDCSWNYEDGKLTITGTGKMSDYSATNQPWNQWKNDITEIEMSGITRIGVLAFWGIKHVTDLKIPATLTSIETGAFQWMSKLSTVTFEEGSKLTTVSHAAFAFTPALETLELPESVSSILGNQFYASGVTSFVIPQAVFKEDGTNGLKDITFKSGMTLYCPKEHQQECEDYITNTAKEYLGTNDEQGHEIYYPVQNVTIATYEKDGDGYFINGSWYKNPNDVLTGNHIKKLRYTVEEAMKATEKGDRFHVSLTYK